MSDSLEVRVLFLALWHTLVLNDDCLWHDLDSLGLLDRHADLNIREHGRRCLDVRSIIADGLLDLLGIAIQEHFIFDLRARASEHVVAWVRPCLGEHDLVIKVDALRGCSGQGHEDDGGEASEAHWTFIFSFICNITIIKPFKNKTQK